MRAPKHVIGIIFYFFTVFIFSCTWHRQKIPCDKYRAGLFYYNNKVSGHRIHIERKDGVQVETDLVSGAVITLKISWKDDCGYVLIFKSEKSPENRMVPAKKMIDSLRKLPVETLILSGDENYYIFESSGMGTDMLYYDTMWVRH